MKKLEQTYNRLKERYVLEIEKAIEDKVKITFSPYIKIYAPNTSAIYFEELTEMEYGPQENTWYVHDYTTDYELQVEEYWIPLRDFTFEQLYEIAEVL